MRNFDNNGTGAVYASFKIEQNEDTEQLIEIGDAVTMSDNKISLGYFGNKLLGRVEHISADTAVVQISGVARFKYREGIYNCDSVVVDGNGNVTSADSETIGDLKITSSSARGTVIFNNDDDKTCDVLL